MACDRSGNLFVSQGDSIFKFAPNGAKKTFVSGLDNPSDLAFDGSGNLFVVEPAAYERNIVTGRDTLTFSPVILKISPDGTRSTFTTGLKGPGALAVDPAGDVYVTDGAANDNSSRAILKFRADGTKSTLTSALGLDTRLGIALDPSGNVFVDMQDSILKFTPDGNSTTFASAGRSSEETLDPSPDGQFAMLLTQTPEGVKIQLVEVSSHTVVADLADSGGPYDENCKLLWATDSQRFAFYQAEHRGGHTTVYFRSNLRFIQVELPSMPGCATPAQKNELRNKGLFKFIEYNTMPKAWLKSGALVVIDDQGWETNDSELRGCTQTVTIVFDAKHEASIQQVTGKKIKKY